MDAIMAEEATAAGEIGAGTTTTATTTEMIAHIANIHRPKTRDVTAARTAATTVATTANHQSARAAKKAANIVKIEPVGENERLSKP
jgi:hypothetical protein